ncbi:serine/threonine protein kinase [Streptomyces abikoensis]|uniref:serine/threonine protein kinase n=1 Tax=Streptomyces abikoensis TaxID=97398 RepID=UPI0036B87500
MARLGEGGMGQVFLAFSPGGQPAAVKVIREEFAKDVEFGRRFAREVTAAQRVRGAHLAPLLDADPRAERPWLATAYVAGPSLRDLVIDHGPLPAGEVMLLAWGIAHALADVHAAKVVHRDLKPGNIMLDESGPKVIDFGIVKSLTQSVTYRSHSTRIGTPLYMSPEQAMGRAVGEASDVFALGSSLYYLATGREAFGADNEWAVAHRIVADDPDLSVLAPPLRRLVAACLRKDGGRRPTPALVREWCEEELGDEPGPGAWMGITGAREAIKQRTGALHALASAHAGPAVSVHPDRSGPDRADHDRAEPDRPGGGHEAPELRREVPPAPTRPYEPDVVPDVPDEPDEPDEPDTPNPPERAPGRTGPLVTRRILAAHFAELLLGAVVMVCATFLPMFSETWTRESSGEQAGRVEMFFDWLHPWDAVSSGIPGVDPDWAGVPVGVIGTAIGLVLAATVPVQAAREPGLQGWNNWALKTCLGWILVVGFFTLFLIGMMIFGGIKDDNPSYTIRTGFMTGGWLLLAANGLMYDAVQRTYGRLRAANGDG